MTRLSKLTHPAYHLRPNKAVDRLLFLELVRILGYHTGQPPHTYIGLGGPFLEEFRLISREFPQMELVCVEQDEETHKRQLFHACSSKMECVHCTLGDYIATDLPSERSIAVWADYSKMNRGCLSEIADVVRKAVPHSLLRITVRAETPIHKEVKGLRYKYPPHIPSKKAEAFENYRDTYQRDMAVDGVVFPDEWFEWTSFSPDEFPRLLSRVIGAVARGACTRPKVFLPLHTVKYSDGTIMLSKTGVICLEEERGSLEQHFQKYFAFWSTDRDEVDTIDVPVLTTRERLTLEGVLPTDDRKGEVCKAKLGYLIEGDASEELSRSKMEQYERYYWLYPHFGKIVP